MDEGPSKPIVELGIEFVIELLLFLYPYGADQMGLPHNFWLGFVCWIVGAIIAVRIFWIIPLWADRLPESVKAAIAVLVLAFFVWLFYKPIMSAHAKWVQERVQETPRADSFPPRTPSVSVSQTSQVQTVTVGGQQSTANPKPIHKKRPQPPTNNPSQSSLSASIPKINSLVDNAGTIGHISIEDSKVSPPDNGIATAVRNAPGRGTTRVRYTNALRITPPSR